MHYSERRANGEQVSIFLLMPLPASAAPPATRVIARAVHTARSNPFLSRNKKMDCFGSLSFTLAIVSKKYVIKRKEME